MPSSDVAPVVLEGKTVRLESLELRHAAGLGRHISSETFRYFGTERPRDQSEEAVEEYIEMLLALDDANAFATIFLETGESIGCTTLMEIRARHKGLEIGRTWIGSAFQGTRVNPECKLLLMQHAFETLKYERVQLKTDERNLQSQRAIEKLGAVKEGVLRKHMVMPDGFVRNTVLYSITAAEWPAVKERLLARLGD